MILLFDEKIWGKKEMYINCKNHYLSKAMSISAIINLIMQVIKAIIRIVLDNANSNADMLNDTVWNLQVFVHIVMIIILFGIFHMTMKSLKKIDESVPPSEQLEIARLQMEYLEDGVSSLSVKSIKQLVYIWEVIFVWSEAIYLLTSIQYRDFVKRLTEMFSFEDVQDGLDFAELYNSTHGFKYIGMFTAIILGVFITGIFLGDKILAIVAIILSLIFSLAFGIFQMVTITTSFKIISIIWTAVIFHALQTIGVLILARYLARHYRGL